MKPLRASTSSREAKTLRTVIFAGYSCNNNCGFCINRHKRHIPDEDSQTIIRAMAKARGEGSDYLELIGGEPTIRTDFLHLIRTAKKLGFEKIVIATNGRNFSRRPFARAAVAAGLTGIMMSLHGPTARIHDGLTAAPGSFQQLLAGISNLQRLGFPHIRANTTVVRQNYRALPALAELYLKLGLEAAELIFVDPSYGGAHSCFAKFVPKISQAAPWMRRCLDIGKAGGNPRWSVRYVPLCHFQSHQDQISEIWERKLFHTVHRAPDFYNADVAGSRTRIARVKPAVCEGCSLHADCEGIWKEYIRVYGDKELCPP